VRLTLGRRAAESGEVEVQLRRGSQARPSISLASAVTDVEKLYRELG
jgi:hypothetical protein